MEDLTRSPEPEQPKEKGIDELVQEAMDAPGYVMVLGILTNETDANGNKKLMHYIRRRNYMLEDALKTFREFRNHLQHIIGNI